MSPQIEPTMTGRVEVIIPKIEVRVKGLKKACGSSKAALKSSLAKSRP